MKLHTHLQKKRVVSICINKASFKSKFIFPYKQKVPKDLVKFYSIIDTKLVKIKAKDILLDFDSRFVWNIF